jgi:hypothetical protein
MGDTRPAVLCGLDVETSGPSYDRNALIAVGANIRDLQTGKSLSNARFVFKMPRGTEFDKRCVSEFWSKHQEELDTFSNEEQHPKDATAALALYLNDHHKEYRMTFVSDNPLFDGGWILHYFQRYLAQPTLLKDVSYTPILSADCFMAGWLHDAHYLERAWLTTNDVSSRVGIPLRPADFKHYPEEEAQYMTLVLWTLQNAKEEQTPSQSWFSRLIRWLTE